MEYGSQLADALVIVIGAFLAIVVLTLLSLTFLRYVNTWRERRISARIKRIEPSVWTVLTDGSAPADASDRLEGAVVKKRDRGALEKVLLDAAPALKGPDREKLTFISERLGYVAEDIHNVRTARGAKKAESAFHLGISGSERGVQALLSALSDSRKPFVVFACLDSLSHIGTPEAIEGVAGYLYAHQDLRNIRVAELLLERRREFAPYVMEWLKEGNEDRNRLLFLLRVAGLMEDPGMYGVIARYTESLDAEVRSVAARALGLLGDPKACPSLFRAMADSHGLVRIEAAEALGRVECDGALAALKEGLADPDVDVKRSCAAALNLLGDHGRAVLKEALQAAESEEGQLAAEVLETAYMRDSNGKDARGT